MTWHIVRKDMTLLWPLILLVALAQIVAAALSLILGHFNEPAELASIAGLFPLVALFGVVLLTIFAVHQDIIPGASQDWLVRPVSRRDLFLAKLLFVLVAVQGPLFAVDAAQALLEGFSATESFGAALTRGVTIFCSLSLPALLLASVTQTITQALFGALGLVVAYAIFIMAFNLLGMLPPPRGGSGLQWMSLAVWSGLALLSTLCVLPPLFARRQLPRARGTIAVAAIVAMATLFLPWQPIFAAQQLFSPQPSLGSAVGLAFAPGQGRFEGDMPPSATRGVAVIFLPLRVAGLARGTMLLLDHAEIRAVGADGKTLYKGTSSISLDGSGSVSDAQLEVHQMALGDVRTHQAIFLKSQDYERLKDQSVRLEIDYSLTVFRADAAQTIAAQGGDQHLGEVGWCKTRLDGDGDEVELACLKPGGFLTCFTATLENPTTGQRNPPYHTCQPDYTPYPASFLGTINRFGGGLKFRDLQGLARYPVDGAQLNHARIAVQFFSPQAHFTRHLTIPAIRLRDWKAEVRLAATTP